MVRHLMHDVTVPHYRVDAPHAWQMFRRASRRMTQLRSSFLGVARALVRARPGPSAWRTAAWCDVRFQHPGRVRAADEPLLISPELARPPHALTIRCVAL